MDDAATFRREAGRYRKLAEEEPNPEVAQRMRDFASHHNALAELVGEAERPPATQPVHQQSKTELDDKT
jgi:hypothetical protein